MLIVFCHPWLNYSTLFLPETDKAYEVHLKGRADT